jgi:hypothetical protein
VTEKTYAGAYDPVIDLWAVENPTNPSWDGVSAVIPESGKAGVSDLQISLAGYVCEGGCGVAGVSADVESAGGDPTMTCDAGENGNGIGPCPCPCFCFAWGD